MILSGFPRLSSTCIFTITLSILLLTSLATASTYVPVNDTTYAILNRLEAEGILKSSMLTTKPLSRKEVARLVLEAEQNSEDANSFIKRYIKILKDKFKDDMDKTEYFKPLDEVTVEYTYADELPSELSTNNDGYDHQEGHNVRAEISSRMEHDWISLYIQPEVQYNEEDTDVTLKRAYGVLDLLGWELQVGADSQWWGPGYHGSLLLSNNPEPMTSVRFTNSSPFLLPWFFEKLGLFKFTGFVTRLEDERVVSKPYLWGMRLNLKPSPYFEIGIHRTALLGGEGQPEGFSTWWDSFWGLSSSDSNVEGDQRGGVDIKMTVPWKHQPFQLYFDGAGEDEAGGLPSNWAYLAGVYLPRIMDFERIEFRAEWVNNHISGKPDVWYNHSIYQSGYTYKGRIIGHHMGTDSEDLFFEASYLFPEMNGRVSLGYDMKEHDLSENIREKKNALSTTVSLDVNESISIKAACTYEKVKNQGNVSGNDENISTAIIQLKYTF